MAFGQNKLLQPLAANSFCGFTNSVAKVNGGGRWPLKFISVTASSYLDLFTKDNDDHTIIISDNFQMT